MTCYLHFPAVPDQGCEGILFLYRRLQSGRGPSLVVLLVDGTTSQLGWLDALLERLDSSARVRVDVRVVLTHYHDDHYSEVESWLFRDQGTPVTVTKVYAPYPNATPLPDEARATRETLKEKLRRLHRKQDTTDPLPRVWFAGPGRLETPVDEDPWAIKLLGGTAARGHSYASPNSQSLVLLGGPSGHRGPSFLLTGDADSWTWDSLETVIDANGALGVWLPVTIYKVAHHGARSNNALRCLKRFLGDPSDRDAALVQHASADPKRCGSAIAVRIRNRSKDPEHAAWVEKKLGELETILWDTRDQGDLWMRLNPPKNVIYGDKPETVGLPDEILACLSPAA